MDYIWFVMKAIDHLDTHCDHTLHEEHEHVLRPARTVSDSARLFQALGSIERLQLMERLLDQEHCVSELAHELEEKVTTISQRLQQLHQARLVTKERRGKHIYYSIADHHVRELLTNTFDHVEEERLR